MIRWLTLVAGVGVAAAALYALLSAPPQTSPRGASAPPPVAAPGARPSAPSAPLGEIDDASRAQLERVLREAEREDAER